MSYVIFTGAVGWYRLTGLVNNLGQTAAVFLEAFSYFGIGSGGIVYGYESAGDFSYLPGLIERVSELQVNPSEILIKCTGLNNVSFVG